MLKLRNLTARQKKFLTKEKMNPEGYLLERTTAESYVFYEKKSGKIISIRR